MAQEIEKKFLVNGDFKSDAFKATSAVFRKGLYACV